jgi:nitrogen fixation protein FixH
VSLGGARQAADLTITLYSAPNPPTRGTNVLEAAVTDAQGQPVADAQVAFDLDMTNMSHGKNVVAATPQGDGRYAGRAFFMMPGPWRAIALVARPGQPTVQARFDFQVKLR